MALLQKYAALALSVQCTTNMPNSKIFFDHSFFFFFFQFIITNTISDETRDYTSEQRRSTKHFRSHSIVAFFSNLNTIIW